MIGFPFPLLAPAEAGAGAASAAGKGSDGSPPGGGGGGGGASNGAADPWYASKDLGLDDDTRKWIEGKNFKDPATALRSGREADTVARSRNVFDKPDPKNIDSWKGWSELGWPEKFDDYKLKRPKLPEGVSYDQAMEDHLRKVAHDAKIPVGAAQKILDGLVGYQNKALDDFQAKGAKTRQELEETLRKDWGDSYGANRELAQRAARHLGVGLDDMSELEEILGAPGLTQLFHKIGKLLGEDSLKTGDVGGGMMTPAAAAAERRRLEADPEWMRIFGNQRHPQYKDLAARREELLKIEAGIKH